MTFNRNKKVLAAVLASAGAVSLWAFAPQTDPPAFGVISVLPTQAMRINVVCMHNPPSERVCNINLGFNGPDGRTLKQAMVTVRPGATAYLELNPADLRGLIDPNEYRAGGSVGIVPTVVSDSYPPDPCHVVPTVEVFDTITGKTDVFLNPAAPRLSLFSTGM